MPLVIRHDNDTDSYSSDDISSSSSIASTKISNTYCLKSPSLLYNQVIQNINKVGEGASNSNDPCKYNLKKCLTQSRLYEFKFEVDCGSQHALNF